MPVARQPFVGLKRELASLGNVGNASPMSLTPERRNGVGGADVELIQGHDQTQTVPPDLNFPTLMRAGYPNPTELTTHSQRSVSGGRRTL